MSETLPLPLTLLLISLVLFSASVVLLVIIHNAIKNGVAQLSVISALMHSLSVGLAESLASSRRLEQTTVDVAQDLSDAHARADAVAIDNHGAAADAASRQTEKEKANAKQQ